MTNQEIANKIQEIKELLERKVGQQEWYEQQAKLLEIEVESLNNSLTELETELKKLTV